MGKAVNLKRIMTILLLIALITLMPIMALV